MIAIKPSACCITLALALYLLFSLSFLELPGLQYDEVNFVNAAMGQKNAPFVAWSAEILGKELPLMIMDYIGALKSALYAPIFRIFGTSAVTVRLPVVGIGLITLLLSYALYRRMFDHRIATVALVLFATDPTFIFANKLDWGPISLMLCLEVASLYFMWRWMREGKRCFLMPAGFLFGLGLYNKMIFAWFLSAFFIAMLLCYRNHLKNLLNRRQLVVFVPFFILGCLPLIAFNINIPMATFREQSIFSFPGINTLINRYHLFRGTLDGGGVYHLINLEELGNPERILTAESLTAGEKILTAVAGFSGVKRSLLPFAFVICLLVIIIFWKYGYLDKKREVLFLVMLLLGIAAWICLNEKATGAHHAVAVYPFVFILIACAICELGRRLGRTSAGTILVVGFCLLPLIITQLVVDARYLKSFQTKGGVGYWSDAIYRLACFARENANRNFLLMDWGFSNQLVLLTNGRIRYEEFSCATNDIDDCLDAKLKQIDSYLVFHVPPFEGGPILNRFKEAVARRGLQERLLKTFYQRDGRPVYAVYEVVRPEVQTYLVQGGFYYFREAEDYDAKSGGNLDQKEGALNKKALGNQWGRRRDDFVSYKFNLSRNMADVHLYLRYAFEDPLPQDYYLFLDGNFAAVVTLPSTHGYGYVASEWKTMSIRLGTLVNGVHELRLQPARENQVVNLDYWYVSDGPFQLQR